MDTPQVIDPAIEIATAMICHYEGFRSEPYEDGFGTETIGYGTTFLEDGSPVTANTPPMTEPEARAYVTAFVGRLVPVIRNMSRPRLSDNQCAALADFSYEEGISALAESTLLREWNDGNVAGAEAQFLVWDYADGRPVAAIEARRKAELALFKTPDGTEVSANPVPKPPAPEDEADELDDEFN
jgi:lysozyme